MILLLRQSEKTISSFSSSYERAAARARKRPGPLPRGLENRLAACGVAIDVENRYKYKYISIISYYMRVKERFTFRSGGKQYLRMFFKDGAELLGGLDIALPTIFQSKLYSSNLVESKLALLYERLGQPDKARKHYEQFIKLDHPLRRKAEQNLAKLEQAMKEGTARVSEQDIRVEQMKLNEQFSVLHVKGPRKTIEEIIKRYYRKEYRNNEPLGATDYVRANYDFSQELELPSELRLLLHAQKKANSILRRIDNEYLFSHLSDVVGANEDRMVAILKDEDVDTCFDEAKRKYKARKKQLQKRFESDDVGDPLLEELKEVVEHSCMLAENFGGQVSVDWEKRRLDLKLEDFFLDDIVFSDKKREEGCVYVAYDIETLGWVGSSTDPEGLHPEIFLASICSEGKEFNEEGLFLDEDAPEDTIEQIAMKYKDIVVGTQDVGSLFVDTEISQRKSRYIHVPDQTELRRVVADIIFYKNPSNTGGNNHDAFDIPRSMNPRRTLSETEEVHYKKIKKSANEPDGVFNPNPDNTGPKYKGQTWKQKCRLAADNKDFLNVSDNYLGSLITDSKLETIGALLDFFRDFGLGYGKIFHSYKEMELSAIRGRQGDTAEAYKNARYCYEDNVAQLRIMMYFDRIFENISDILGMDSALLFSGAKPNVRSLFWDRELFQKTGMLRIADDKKPYEEVDARKEKKTILDWGAEKDLRQMLVDGALTASGSRLNLETRLGLTKNCKLYNTPTLSEGLAEVIENNEKLKQLYQYLEESDDPIERVILQQMLDSLLIEPRIDLLRVKAREMDTADFEIKYSVDFRKVRETMKRKVEEVAEMYRGARVVAYDGDLVAVEGELPGCKPIADADVLCVGNETFVYRLLKEGKEPVLASRGVGIPSMKRRHSADYILDGFQPNSIMALEHDFALMCFEDSVKAASLRSDLRKGMENSTLPLESYFITLRPGQRIETYSLPYRRTKRFKLMDLTGVEKGEKRTYVCVETGTDELVFKEVNPHDPESMAQLQPNKEFYLRWLKEASKKVDRFEKAIKTDLQMSLF
jgi:tetratricopeptide (TPR) repeat protein